MPKSLAETSSSFTVMPENKSVIVFDERVTAMPSIVNAASLALTTSVAESFNTPSLFSGSYFITSTALPESDVVTRMAFAAPSGDLTMSE